MRRGGRRAPTWAAALLALSSSFCAVAARAQQTYFDNLSTSESPSVASPTLSVAGSTSVWTQPAERLIALPPVTDDWRPPAAKAAAAPPRSRRYSVASVLNGEASVLDLGGGTWCDDCPNRSLAAFVGYDSWRGVSDDSWQNNGIHTGLNFGTRLGRLSDLTQIGFQAGGSIGIYDWAGTDYRLRNQNQAETQGFLTYGFFRKANENCKWSASVVQDLMLNSNFGVFAQSPTLGQWRAQLGYAINPWNEIGVWGACRAFGDSRQVSGVGSTTWRSVNQLNPYWHHKWGAGGADTWLWVGVPEHTRLSGGGSLGDYIAGAAANVPLSDRVALYTLVTYMHPSARAGAAGSEEDSWNFSIGLAVYPSRNARSSTVAGQCWTPQMAVANNGTFMVDTNRH